MLNLSFCNRIVPSELIIASVVPIYKGGDKILFKNNKPVSVSPVDHDLNAKLSHY